MKEEDEEIVGAEEAKQCRKFGGDVERHELGQIRCGEGGVQENGESDAEKLGRPQESWEIFEAGRASMW